MAMERNVMLRPAMVQPFWGKDLIRTPVSGRVAEKKLQTKEQAKTQKANIHVLPPILWA